MRSRSIRRVYTTARLGGFFGLALVVAVGYGPVSMQESRNWLPWVLGGCGCFLLLGGTAAVILVVFAVGSEERVRSPQAATEEVPPVPVLPPPGQVPRVVSATVTSVTGSAPVQHGAMCSFAIEQHPKEGGGIWCRSQVSCGTTILYGAGANNGYYNCTLSENPPMVTGEDSGTTSQDTDPAIAFSTQRGELTIRDDAQGQFGAYTLTARLTVVN